MPPSPKAKERIKTAENGGLARTVFANQKGKRADVELLPAGKAADIFNNEFSDIHTT